MCSASRDKIAAPPMVYISGEEMTHYAMNLILKDWVEPYVDTKEWKFFEGQMLRDYYDPSLEGMVDSDTIEVDVVEDETSFWETTRQ